MYGWSRAAAAPSDSAGLRQRIEGLERERDTALHSLDEVGVNTVLWFPLPHTRMTQRRERVVWL